MKITAADGLTLIKYAAIGFAAYYAYRKVSQGVNAVGDIWGGLTSGMADAAGKVWDVATYPVTAAADAFGILPGTYPDGTPKWERTTPWASIGTTGPVGAVDPVSNNDQGINWNYF